MPITNDVFARARKLSIAASGQAGFGMIELLAAMSVLSVGILALFVMFQAGIVEIRRAGNVTTAAALADSEMEKFRAVKFAVIGLDDADVAAADATYKADAAYRDDAPATALAGAIDAAATSVSVTSAAGFPTAAPFRIKVESEVMLVEAISGATTWTVKRGVDNTVAAAHGAVGVVQKRRVHVAGASYKPTRSVVGADGRTYRLDTYITWQASANAAGIPGRNVKLVTLVVRSTASPSEVLARVSSSFDEATGL